MRAVSEAFRRLITEPSASKWLISETTINELRSKVQELTTQRAAVLRLHRSEFYSYLHGHSNLMACSACKVPYPCDTAKALGVAELT